MIKQSWNPRQMRQQPLPPSTCLLLELDDDDDEY